MLRARFTEGAGRVLTGGAIRAGGASGLGAGGIGWEVNVGRDGGH